MYIYIYTGCGIKNNPVVKLLFLSNVKLFFLANYTRYLVAFCFPNADVGSDHQLVIANVRCKHKNVVNKQTSWKHDVTKLADHSVRDMFKGELLQKCGDARNSVEGSWKSSVKDAFHETAIAILENPPKHATNEWLSATTLELSDERRRLKGIKCTSESTRRRHNLLCREIKRRCSADKKAYILTICQKNTECTLPEQKPVIVSRRPAHHWSQGSTCESGERQKWDHDHQFKTGQRQMEGALRATVQSNEHG